jgi:hypothetical protein
MHRSFIPRVVAELSLPEIERTGRKLTSSAALRAGAEH